MLERLTRTQRFDGADIWLNRGVVAIQARVIEGIQHAGRFSSRLQEREDDQEVFFLSSEIQSARVRPNNVKSMTSCLESKGREGQKGARVLIRKLTSLEHVTFERGKVLALHSWCSRPPFESSCDIIEHFDFYTRYEFEMFRIKGGRGKSGGSSLISLFSIC